MQDAKVRAALIAVCLACLLGSGAVLVAGHRTAPPPVIITSPPAENSAPPAVVSPAVAARPAAPLLVDVAGAVRRPSLYALPPGSRVMQALRAAGGPTSAADLNAVNLAEKVSDGDKIYVPARVPVSSDAPAPPRVGVAKSAPATHSGKLMDPAGPQISLNTATAEELERLPGVGPALAGRILAYRTQAGGFGKIEDLRQVTGIGPKKFAKIAPYITLN